MRSFLLGAFVASAFWLMYHSHAEDWVVMSGLAKHLDGQIHCNSTTSGLGLEHNNYALGFYRNSNCRWSFYAGKAWLPLQYSNVKLGILSGAATGYKEPITPAGGFVATYEKKTWGANLIFVPPLGDSGNVLWLQFKKRF